MQIYTLLTYLLVLLCLLVLSVILFCLIYTIQSKRINKYSCFIAGATSLSKERDAIRAVISEVNNQRKRISLSAYTFEDFPTSVVTGGAQDKFYNKFLRASTDIAVFIIDGEIGRETTNEFEVAYNAYKESGKPIIYTYCKNNGERHEQADQFKQQLESINHYWTPYNNLSELKLEFNKALVSNLDSKIGELSNFDEKHKRQKNFNILLMSIMLMIISIPITKYINNRIENGPSIDITDKGTRKGASKSTESKVVDKLSITDELITQGYLTINHTEPVKFWITSEDPSTTTINWDKVQSTLNPGDVLYPKTNSYIYLHAENDNRILETCVWFSFYEFVEYSIKQGNKHILNDMFYSLEDSDVASYVLNETATDLLTKYNAEVFFRNITNGYKITHIEFQTEPDILSSNYPKIKMIKCSKDY